MARTKYEAWGWESERLRDEVLKAYNRAKTPEERDAIVEKMAQSLKSAQGRKRMPVPDLID